MRWFGSCLVLAGCGRLAFDVQRTGDAAADAAASDAPGPMCDPMSPFTAISPLADVNMAGENCSTLTPFQGAPTDYFYLKYPGDHVIHIPPMFGQTRSDPHT